MKRRHGVKWALIVSAVLLMGVSFAQEDVGDIPDKIRAMPQFSGDKPPTPLSSSQEQAVLDAVFLRFSDLDRSETMNFIRKHFPEGSKEFTLMSHRNLGNAMALLIDLIGQGEMLMNLRSRNPAHFAKVLKHRELERKINTLAGELTGLDSSEVSPSELELRSVLSRSFLLKQDLMKTDIENMERQLDELRRLVKKRADNQDVIIDNRYLDMVGKLDHMKW